MKRVLIIEDEAPLRSLIRLTLEAEGLEVLEAADGDEGIISAQANLPDLILSDVSLGCPDGPALLSILRSDPLTAGIPLIFMTGCPDQMEKLPRNQDKADGYLAKPFGLGGLLEVVHSQLANRAAM
jgi:two-component system phosphate regulon response regulator PhoB